MFPGLVSGEEEDVWSLAAVVVVDVVGSCQMEIFYVTRSTLKSRKKTAKSLLYMLQMFLDEVIGLINTQANQYRPPLTVYPSE